MEPVEELPPHLAKLATWLSGRFPSGAALKKRNGA
jgi:hypothetical protein